ncbi:zinc ABC transporter substrate-binding protein [Paenibacillus sp. sptzw28]|nr:zinc ABC transporter substrate-binding protein [Paenibacillus sp. sptzw28]
MLRSKIRLSCFAALMALALLLSGCGSAVTKTNAAGSSPTGKIKIVAAENFLGEVASAVGGDSVEVTSVITNPNADPHDFEPTAQTSKEVSDAQVIVYVGIGYDEWMNKLVTANSSPKTVINLGEGLLGKKDGDNPHVWYIPESMPKLADALAGGLGKIDPSQADAFKKRAQEYKNSLAPLMDLVAKLKQASPVDIAVSEPVFDYMAAALNLNVIDPGFAKAIEEEADPAPGDVAALQDALKEKKVKLFVQNTQAESPTVATIVDAANANQVPVVQVTETEPQGKDYLKWMTDQLTEVQHALGIK